MNDLSTVKSLQEYLSRGTENDFPIANASKRYIDRYNELDKKFATFSVEMGAMKAEAVQWRNELAQKIEEINKITDSDERLEKFREQIDEDTIIFLNKHGADHIRMVQDKALEILKCFTRDVPSFYETFLLLCAISVHDVGNMYGRQGHEKRIRGILDSECTNIIDDSIEKRTIARIAGVHGGRIRGSKDTISNLQTSIIVNNRDVRERMLAAVLRFADELADDSSRQNNPAMKAGILGKTSEIFHVYSSKLHSVLLKENSVKTWDIILRFGLDEETATKRYKKLGEDIYLLDEIYSRTFKMESERRYCNRFLQAYCSIERINVEITIENKDDLFNPELISYTLEEKGYPNQLYESIKDIDSTYLTGEEMAQRLSTRALD